MPISIRQYAKSRHVTYEAVRRQVTRYAKELEGHTEIKNKTCLLDDEACEFLDLHRMKKSIIVDDTDARTETDILRAEIDRLKSELDKQKDMVISLQAKNNKLIEEKSQYIEDKAKNDTLLMIADKEHEELETARKEIAEMQSDLQRSQDERNALQAKNEESQKELSKYHKSLFGFYRKD